MILTITDPDHVHYGKTAVLIPREGPEQEVNVAQLPDGTRTTILSSQVRWEWRDGTDD